MTSAKVTVRKADLEYQELKLKELKFIVLITHVQSGKKANILIMHDVLISDMDYE